MTDALARPTPRIDHPEELERMVRQIVERVDPVAIYRFGSRARGDAREDSDYHLLIAVPDDFPCERTMPSCAFALIEDRKIPMDAAPEPEPTASDIEARVAEIESLKADFERRPGRRGAEGR